MLGVRTHASDDIHKQTETDRDRQRQRQRWRHADELGPTFTPALDAILMAPGFMFRRRPSGERVPAGKERRKEREGGRAGGREEGQGAGRDGGTCQSL
jgi:hypothetical protein